MFELVAPNASYYLPFLASHREWDGAHPDDAGHLGDDDITSPKGFAAWVRRLVGAERAAETGGMVPTTYRWITACPRYVGAIAFRHYLTPKLLDSGGNTGYRVRPSNRGPGGSVSVSS